eukprot:7232820-Prymnesium_polylepis.1
MCNVCAASASTSPWRCRRQRACRPERSGAPPRQTAACRGTVSTAMANLEVACSASLRVHAFLDSTMRLAAALHTI